MALLSPGVQVSVIDQSNYTPAASSSVPYILLATAQNKISGAGTGIAPGTLAVNANKVYLMTSQRDLLSTYGVPFFYNTTAGTPINGYELNEYGLLAAYSALGVSNQCYVQRVDVDLAALTATLVRPTGNPNNGTYWLDTVNSTWGINQWNQTTGQFTNQTPTVITSSAYLETSSTVPLQSYGSIGDYAVVASTDPTVADTFNLVYYKRGGPIDSQAPTWVQDSFSASELYNTWVLVGSDEWKTAWPTIQGSNAPTSLTTNDTININGQTVTVGQGATASTVLGLAEAINTQGITGVYAAAIGGKLFLYADSTATNDGSTEGTGVISIANGGVGTPLTTLGITSDEYAAPAYFSAPSYSVPNWRTTAVQPEPTGSVFQQTNSVNQGASLIVKRYDSTLGTFVTQSCPIYDKDTDAIYAMDPSGGGANIPVGTTYAQVDPLRNSTSGLEILSRLTTGATIVTALNTNATFTNNSTFTMQATEPGTAAYTTLVTVTITSTLGLDAAGFCSAVSAAGVNNVSATVNSSGAIVFTHATGGEIVLADGTNTPLATAGFSTSCVGVRLLGTGPSLVLSNWVGTPTFTYVASSSAPDQDPESGTYWYYSDATTTDIMIQNNGAWYGYQNVTSDVRGYNLSTTNATGPIFSATAPTTQTDSAQSPLVYGDLWIDTSDLENYPLLSRWENVSGQDQWVTIDNTDQTTVNGILFADARWAPNGTTNPVSDALPTITSLLVSNYLDLDAPNAQLYPEGTLLWNTRRSGFNVKTFEYDYFNATTFPDDTLPTQTSTWVTASANRADGSPNMGRYAQRAIIVSALRVGIDSNTQIRETQAEFNLIACPQYPELAPNMIVLNNDRGDTAFSIVDTPLRLTPEEIATWATNNNSLGLSTGDGNLSAGDAYSAAFYPSCTTTDLTGNVVATAPSHMMIRTIIRSDSVSYPWFAPAGLRRGVVDNATQIGYVVGSTGEFQPLGVNQGLRDTLYSNNVNPITFIPGTGITNFGNHTLQGASTALDRINVARLVAYLRGRLEIIGNQYLFEPNDSITRQSITAQITSLMTELVNKRGLYDYLVVCDLTNNTPATIDANELFVDIAIEPVKAVEFIYIPMRIQNTGTIAAQQSA